MNALGLSKTNFSPDFGHGMFHLIGGYLIHIKRIMIPRTSKIFLLILFLFFGLQIAAQDDLYLDINQSSLKIEGTSSLHDWMIIARQMNGSAILVKDRRKIRKIT